MDPIINPFVVLPTYLLIRRYLNGRSAPAPEARLEPPPAPAYVDPAELEDLVDAYTRIPLDPKRQIYRCQHCSAFYHAETYTELCRERGGTCVACLHSNGIRPIRLRRRSDMTPSWQPLVPHRGSRLAHLAALDPYELLGVSPGVPRDVLRAAYLDKLKAYHPDHADAFFRDYGGEVTKLLNLSYSKIRRAERYD